MTTEEKINTDTDMDADEDFDKKGGVGDIAKKLLAVGIGAAFLTEESIRKAVKGVQLPGEVIDALLKGANKSKEELTNRVSNEIIKIISKIDFVKEASKFVEEHKFSIKAEIEVNKRADSSGGNDFSVDVKSN